MRLILIFLLIEVSFDLFSQPDPYHPGYLITNKTIITTSSTPDKKKLIGTTLDITKETKITSKNGDTICTYTLQEKKKWEEGKEFVGVRSELLDIKLFYPNKQNEIHITRSSKSTFFRNGLDLLASNPKNLSYYDTLLVRKITKKDLKKAFKNKSAIAESPQSGTTYLSNYSINFEATPLFTKSRLLVNDYQFDRQNDLEDRQKSESHGFGLSTAFKIGKRIGFSNHVYLQFLYLQQSFITNNYKIDWSTGLSSESSVGKSTYTSTYRGIGIGYSYHTDKKNYRFFFDVSTNFILKAKMFPVLSTTNTIDNTTNYGFAAIVSGGGIFKIWKCFNIKTGPTFFYNFTPVHKGVVNTSFYSLGLNFGVVLIF